MPPKKIKRKIDTKMKDAGEFDTDTRVMKVNPRKCDMLNTIIHEELHAIKPKLKEKQLAKKTEQIEKKLTPTKAIGLLKKFVRPSSSKPSGRAKSIVGDIVKTNR